jgi:transposase
MPSGRGRKRRRQATSLGAAAGVSRPHRAVRYRLSFDYGWAVVEEYQLNYGTPAASSRAIAAHFVAQGVKLSKTFVQDTLRRWRRCGDPTQLRTGGCTARRANDAERRWMKAELREQPDLYFFELRAKFVQRWRWAISDRMISQALKVDGGVEGDEPLTLKMLERMARQRNEELRAECREALTGDGALPECYAIMDESSMDRRTLRRRRGWAPRGVPAKLYEMFEVEGSNNLQSLLAVVNKDGFVLDACKLVKGGLCHNHAHPIGHFSGHIFAHLYTRMQAHLWHILLDILLWDRCRRR